MSQLINGDSITALIKSLQEIEGVNQKNELVAALIGRGITANTSMSMATLTALAVKDVDCVASNILSTTTIDGVAGSVNLSNLTAPNILKGVTINGVVGTSKPIFDISAWAAVTPVEQAVTVTAEGLWTVTGKLYNSAGVLLLNLGTTLGISGNYKLGCVRGANEFVLAIPTSVGNGNVVYKNRAGIALLTKAISYAVDIVIDDLIIYVLQGGYGVAKATKDGLTLTYTNTGATQCYKMLPTGNGVMIQSNTGPSTAYFIDNVATNTAYISISSSWAGLYGANPLVTFAAMALAAVTTN